MESPYSSDWLQKLGIKALATGAISPEQAQANAASISQLRTKGPYSAPAAQTAQANQGQIQAQFNPTGVSLPVLPPQPAGSGMKQALSHSREVTHSSGVKTGSENTETESTTTDDESRRMQAASQGHTVGNVLSPEKIQTLEDYLRHTPEGQASLAGTNALEDRIKMMEGRPLPLDWRPMMAALDRMSAVTNGHETNQAANSPATETAQGRDAKILQYMQKLQQDKQAQQNAFINFVGKAKSGTDTNKTSDSSALISKLIDKTGSTDKDTVVKSLADAIKNMGKASAESADPNKGVNAQNRLDNLEYRQMIRSIDSNPTLKNQMAGLFSLEQSQGILKGKELNRNSFAEAQNLSRLGAQAGNGIRTTGDERSVTYMNDLSKQIDAFLENYVSGGNLKIPQNDPQVKHFIELNKQLYGALQDNKERVVKAVSAGHGRILHRGTPESDSMREDFEDKMRAYGAVGAGGAFSPAPSGRVSVMGPNGERKTLPATQVDQFLADPAFPGWKKAQ